MTFEALSRHPVFVDQFELGPQGEIRHVGLADAADLLLVAPATANLIGKLAQGIADDALSTLYLATRAPVVLAPPMNVNMWGCPRLEPGFFNGFCAVLFLCHGPDPFFCYQDILSEPLSLCKAPSP